MLNEEEFTNILDNDLISIEEALLQEGFWDGAKKAALTAGALGAMAIGGGDLAAQEQGSQQQREDNVEIFDENFDSIESRLIFQLSQQLKKPSVGGVSQNRSQAMNDVHSLRLSLLRRGGVDADVIIRAVSHRYDLDSESTEMLKKYVEIVNEQAGK